MRFLLRPLFFFLFPTIHKGGRIRHKGRGIVIANHQSAIDIIILGYTVRRQIHFMAKDTLFKNRFMAWIWRNLGVFPVNRKTPGPSTIKKTYELLKAEKILAMFPEGTRNFEHEGELQALKKGLATFALKTKSPIIPTFICRRPRVFRLQKIIVGKAFELTELYDKKIDDDVIAEATAIISAKMNELREQDQAKRKKKLSK